MIIRYSIEAFDRAIVIREVISWGFTILYVLGFIRISNILNDGSKSKEASG
ncbi:integral membrane protein [Geobacillus kaustophilus GBlys]|uniref:Integral membrane protein n=1 Tax=Geobacillus kaustophilus GBlys TaxID=1337888 RepID=U2X798_GEOKU|nr:integral membrane protein [Geobacillus kaustophilus GBlys]